jgi:hypothetical protein
MKWEQRPTNSRSGWPSRTAVLRTHSRKLLCPGHLWEMNVTPNAVATKE